MPERQVPRETKETEERTVHREVPEIPVPLVKEALTVRKVTRELLAKQQRYKVLRESPDQKATMAMMEPMDRTVPWVHLDQGVSPGHLEIKVRPEKEVNGVQTDQKVIRDLQVLMETRDHLERLVRLGTLGQKEKQALEAFRVLLETMATRERRD